MAEAPTIAPDGPERAPHAPTEFLPGSIIAGRYRIVARVGRGGMGEVYRADDLTLGQSVALKFMAPEIAASPARRERFMHEVRVARQVTHPNVCRVHDIGVRDDDRAGAPQLYLSMEFVDGEDLASLVRRIGRLPPDKAAQVGAQICAGLAAAHAQGVLHRDLKPANIMLDGRGQVRITDFGLAELAADQAGAAPRAGRLVGTPAYMSPEQLAGEPATVRSDVFALGLVLYELFTGERAVRAETLEAIARQVGSRDFPLPGARVADIAPAAEAAIMRCLEPRPEDRPSSVSAVAAALPGGDALAHALAAGQTPDPSVLAVSGSSGRLSPLAVALWSALCLAGVLATALLNDVVSLQGVVRPAKAPAVLVEKARELLARFGLPAAPVPGEAWGVHANIAMLDHIEESPGPAPAPGWWRWLNAGPPYPPALEFWFRRAPDILSPAKGEQMISAESPPPGPGEVVLRMDLQGRLTALHAPPPDAPDGAPAPAETGAGPPWSALLEAAGLDAAALSEAAPSGSARTGDAQRAWTFTIPDGPLAGVAARVEAAAVGARPVLFRTAWPWGASAAGRAPTPLMQRLLLFLLVLPVIFVPLAVAAAMARRNWLAGRGDRRGARRVAVAVFIFSAASALLASDHAPALDEYDRIAGAVGLALLEGGASWFMYLAIEPAVRRRRPGAILAWTRLTSGRWKDPMVARDVLRGLAIGAAWTAVYKGAILLASHLPHAPAPSVPSEAGLRAVPHALGLVVESPSGSVQYGLIMLLALLLPSRQGRWRRLRAVALGVFVLMMGVIMLGLLGQPQAGNSTFYLLPFGMLTAAGYFLLLAGLGLLVAVAATSTAWALVTCPTTIDTGAWYAPMGLCPVVAVLGLGAWAAFGCARAVRPAQGGPASAMAP